MPRGKSSTANVLTVGWIGTGSLPEEETYLDTTLGEYLDAQEKDGLSEVRILIPVTGDGFTEDMEAIIDWCKEAELDYEAVVDQAEKLPRALQKHKDAAVKSHAFTDVTAGLVKLLAEGPNGRLLILWDDEDEDGMNEIAGAAFDAEVPVYDFLQEMTRLEADGDDGEDVVESGEGDAAEVYSEADLEGMDLPALKEVAKELEISPVPRTKAALIEKILDAQPNDGEPEDDAELPADTSPAAELPADEVGMPVGSFGLPEGFWDTMRGHMHEVLQEHASGNGKVAPQSPPEAAEEAPTPRRRGRPPKAAAEAPAAPARRGARRG